MAEQAKDLTGQRFGHWTVLGRAKVAGNRHAMWACICDCGTERNVDGAKLRSGKSKSCGCVPFTSRDLAGRRFGRLTAVERVLSPLGKGQAYWLCICDCGKSCTVRASNLTTGNTRSCGCLQRDVARGKDIFNVGWGQDTWRI